MHNILSHIAAYKVQEVAERKELYPTALLERSVSFQAPALSLKHYLKRADKSGIIAEIKRRSPSLGPINQYLSVEQVSIGYMQGGASALSVLTDTPSFGGSLEDLKQARKFNLCPILRKEFILDEYQIIESRSIGADAVLLIAAMLTPNQVKQLARLAHELGMEVLLEVHNQQELDYWTPEIGLVGVNNRDLTNFKVDVKTSHELVQHLPKEAVWVSESGLKDALTLAELKQLGYSGFLIGESFLKTPNPAEACAKLGRQLASLTQSTSILPQNV